MATPKALQLKKQLETISAIAREIGTNRRRILTVESDLADLRRLGNDLVQELTDAVDRTPNRRF